MLFAIGDKKAGCISIGFIVCVNIGYNWGKWSI